MEKIVFAILIAIISALFAGFLTYYFSTRNITSKIYGIVRSEIDKGVIIHDKEKHQLNITEEIDKHEKECGVIIRNTMDIIQNTIHKMELRQNTINLKLTVLTQIMSKVAEKMQITITPDIVSNIGDE